MTASRYGPAVLVVVALTGCHSTKCGIGTHEADGRVFTGGNIRDIDLDTFSTTAYLATETNGLVIVDVSDVTNPTVLSTTKTPSAVVAVAEDAGYVAIASWTDTRVYDVLDPASPAMVGATRITVPKTYPGDSGLRPDITGRELAVDLHGDVLYNGDWWTPYTFRVIPTNPAPYIYLPETVNLLSVPGDLDVGESASTTLEVHNDGNADLTLYNNWVDNAAFTVSPWQARIPPGGSTTLTITFTASVPPVLETGDTGAGTPVEEAWVPPHRVRRSAAAGSGRLPRGQHDRARRR
jgi:hypothetical protein